MKQKILFLFFSILISCAVHAQKEAWNWAFGYGAGLTWQPDKQRSFEAKGLDGTPDTTLDNLPGTFTSAISTVEGCFSMSNKDGELMFYSDGISIWRGDHTKIYDGLPGHSSSAQSGIVIPYPGDNERFICVGLTVDSEDVMGYVIVKATNSTDAVVEGDIEYFSGHNGKLGESMSAVKHANGTDWWIVAPGVGTAINAWLVTSAGVQATSPQVSSVNVAGITGNSALGYFKFRADGQAYVWATNMRATLFYGKFNNSTGQASEGRKITLAQPYGIEFSPNQKYLYVNHVSVIQIYDFDAMIAGSTNTHMKEIKGVGTSGSRALQLDYMGRMWLPYANKNMLVIENPDEPDNVRAYRLENFLSASSQIGLPSFSASFFENIYTEPVLGTIGGVTSTCRNISRTFTMAITNGTGSYALSHTVWDFGDGSPTVNNTTLSGTQSQSHTYTTPGTYTITVTPILASDGSEVTSLRQTKTITVTNCDTNPTLGTIGGAATTCQNTSQTFTLAITNGTGDYALSRTVWDFGDGSATVNNSTLSGTQSQSHTYTTPGTYTITVKAILASDGSEVTSLRKTKTVTVTTCETPATIGEIEGVDVACINKVVTFQLPIANGTGENELSHAEWNFGDGTVVTSTDLSPVSGKQTQTHTYTNPKMPCTVTVRFYLKSDGSEVAALAKTFQINISPCMFPVNPNVHMH